MATRRLIRPLIVCSAGCGAHRTYLYMSYLLAVLCFPYIMVKMVLYHYGPDAIPASWTQLP